MDERQEWIQDFAKDEGWDGGGGHRYISDDDMVSKVLNTSFLESLGAYTPSPKKIFT